MRHCALWLALVLNVHAADLPDKFISALHQVESSGRFGPILGDGGKALGPFQIHHRYWKDARVPGTYAQCADYGYSVRVVTAYLNRYGRRYVAQQNFEALARIHNGGPDGFRRSTTVKYWKRVLPQLTCKKPSTKSGTTS